MFFKWQDNSPITLRCIDKYFETHDTVSIKLAEPTGSLRFQFKPGQFINLGVEINGIIEFRSYSISSNSGETYLQLTIKRFDYGKVSNFIIDSLAIGDTVQSLPPTGDFNCIDHPPKPINGQTKVLLISAGCGITPVFAMAQHWLNNQENIDIEFLHIARSLADTIYLKQLETFSALYSQFHLNLLLKEYESNLYQQGRLNSQWLSTLFPDINNRTVYLCGPNQFMQDTQEYLNELGFDMNNFYQESFTPVQTPSPNHLLGNDDVCIYVPNFSQTIIAKKGERLSDVLEHAGLPLILACRSGICGSCKCKINKGNLSSSSKMNLTDKEISQGYVLACSSTIDSDIDVNIG